MATKVLSSLAYYPSLAVGALFLTLDFLNSRLSAISSPQHRAASWVALACLAGPPALAALPLVLLALGLAYVSQLAQQPQLTRHAGTIANLDKAASTRMMSFNIRCGINGRSVFNIDETAATINRSGASIVLLQEVTDRGQNGTWVGTTCIKNPPVLAKSNQAAELARKCGHLPYSAYNGAHRLERGGTFGVAILSAFPILEVRRLRYTHWRGRQARGAIAIRTTLQDSGRDGGGGKGGGGGSGSSGGSSANNAGSSGPTGWIVCTHLQNDLTGLEQIDEANELLDFVQGLFLPGPGDEDDGKRQQDSSSSSSSSSSPSKQPPPLSSASSSFSSRPPAAAAVSASFVVLGGDLNALPWMASPKIIDAVLGPSLGGRSGVGGHSGYQGTFPLGGGGRSILGALALKLDYLWVAAPPPPPPPTLQAPPHPPSHSHSLAGTSKERLAVPLVSDWQVLAEEKSSDHYPVVATLSW